jgi:hypothetical protein
MLCVFSLQNTPRLAYLPVMTIGRLQVYAAIANSRDARPLLVVEMKGGTARPNAIPWRG